MKWRAFALVACCCTSVLLLILLWAENARPLSSTTSRPDPRVISRNSVPVITINDTVLRRARQIGIVSRDGRIRLPESLVGLLRALNETGRGSNGAFRVSITYLSYDRGRNAQRFKGDKLLFLLRQFEEAVKLCELGLNVEVTVVAAWNATAEAARLAAALPCARERIVLRLWDTFSPSEIGLELGIYHREVVRKRLDVTDLFFAAEDDVLVTALNVRAHLENSLRLWLLGLEDRYYPGFLRVEHVVHSNVRPHREPYQWESDSETMLAREWSPFGAWALASSKTMAHQACWVATRQQVLDLERMCRLSFIEPRDIPAGVIKNVPYWIGGLQIYKDSHGKRRKALHLDTLESSQLVVHMTQNKLTHRKAPQWEKAEAISRMVLALRRRAVLAPPESW